MAPLLSKEVRAKLATRIVEVLKKEPDMSIMDVAARFGITDSMVRRLAKEHCPERRALQVAKLLADRQGRPAKSKKKKPAQTYWGKKTREMRVHPETLPREVDAVVTFNVRFAAGNSVQNSALQDALLSAASQLFEKKMLTISGDARIVSWSAAATVAVEKK